VAGILLSSATGVPPGPLVVLVGTGMFLASVVTKRIMGPRGWRSGIEIRGA